MISFLISLGAVVYGLLWVTRWWLRQVWGSIDRTNEISARGKVVLITGANAGIGKITALEFAKRDAVVVLACRDLNRADGAVDWIRKRTSLGQLTCMKLDLGNLQSVRDFAKAFQDKFDRLDFLINNAGLVADPEDKKKTSDGFELHMGVNHLGHFLLTNLLLDLIKKSAPARIVNLASMAHSWHSFNINDIMSEKEEVKASSPLVEPNALYSRSKMANMLFNKELAKRLEGTGVTTYALCPGAVATEIINPTLKGRDAIIWTALWPLFQFVLKTPEEGAATTLYCALSKSLTHNSGEAYWYCKNWRQKHRAVLKDEEAKSLWEQSAKLVGL